MTALMASIVYLFVCLFVHGSSSRLSIKNDEKIIDSSVLDVSLEGEPGKKKHRERGGRKRV